MGTSPEKIASLDGLRAFAVISVMLFHIGFPGFSIGGLGVDLFFCLSGFLITHLFLKEFNRTGKIHLLHFWARRCLRLMPVYWIYLSIIGMLIGLGYGELQNADGWSPAQYILSMWLYFINYLPAGGLWTEQYLTIHLWSLAIEEQFYLIWPFVIFLLFRFSVVLKGALIIFALFLIYYCTIADEFELQREISGRGIVLFMGCLFAVLCHTPKIIRYVDRLPSGIIAVAVLVFFAAISAAVYLGYYDVRTVKVYFGGVFGLLFCLLIAVLFRQQASWTHKILEWPPLVYIGRISYGIYLYHIGVQVLVWEFIYPDSVFGGAMDYLIKVLLFFVLSLAIASFSFYCIEHRFLRLKDKFR